MDNDLYYSEDGSMNPCFNGGQRVPLNGLVTRKTDGKSLRYARADFGYFRLFELDLDKNGYKEEIVTQNVFINYYRFIIIKMENHLYHSGNKIYYGINCPDNFLLPKIGSCYFEHAWGSSGPFLNNPFLNNKSFCVYEITLHGVLVTLDGEQSLYSPGKFAKSFKFYKSHEKSSNREVPGYDLEERTGASARGLRFASSGSKIGSRADSCHDKKGPCKGKAKSIKI